MALFREGIVKAKGDAQLSIYDWRLWIGNREAWLNHKDTESTEKKKGKQAERKSGFLEKSS